MTLKEADDKLLALELDILSSFQDRDAELATELDNKHLDSNGVVLESGDTVTLIKDLNDKGAVFSAERGTAVRNISLVPDTPEHIEGRVNGQQIVILTRFVKKSA